MEKDFVSTNCFENDNIQTSCEVERKCKKTKKFIKKGMHLLNKNFPNNGTEFLLSEEGRVIFIVNGGLTTGADNSTILELFLSSGIKEVENVVMVPGKQYSFVVLKDCIEAKKAVKILSGVKCLPHCDNPLYMDCINKVPAIRDSVKYELPPGLKVIENFITKDEELILSNLIRWEEKPNNTAEGSTLKHREVRHFGYEFSYSSNKVDKLFPLDRPIPKELISICERIVEKKLMKDFPEQLTINRYLPGQGIPPHVDTHSAFTEEIVSLSILGSVSMEFKCENENEKFESSNCSVYLPARSLCVMTGPSRYLYTHGISLRKTDVVPLEGDSRKLFLSRRTERISFTFRKLSTSECACAYPSKCDSQNYGKKPGENDSTPQQIHSKSSLELEKDHVLNVYEEIADHFDQTRHKPWPKVLQFVQSLPKGTIMLDVGCGNGKYLSGNSQIFSLGVDNCSKLLQICKDKKFEACLSNCLNLPFRSNTFDAVVCIAVIHHLSSQERRLKALRELIRVLNENGVGLVYVWAMEQRKGESLSAYLKQNKSNRIEKSSKKSVESHNREDNKISSHVQNISSDGSDKPNNLLIHENRTDFLEQDMFVPWKKKNQKKTKENITENESIYHRYYHVFREGELENLFSDDKSVKVLSSYYDEGNWCVSFQKMSSS